MKIWYSILGLVLFSCLCCKPNREPVNVADIEKLMLQQQENWNQANVSAFMQTYWESDSLVFIGKRGLTYGWNATLANYKRSYPDKTAMGRLAFENKKHEVMSDSSVYTIGKWTLYRLTDTLGGHYTLLWKKIRGEWKIVADHTS